MFTHKHTCPNTHVYPGNRTIHEVISWPLLRTQETTLSYIIVALQYWVMLRLRAVLDSRAQHHIPDAGGGVKMDPSVYDELWNADFQFWGSWVFDRMHGIYLVDFPQLEQWICLLMQPAICSRPKRQIFLFEKKKLGWTIRPSKEDTKRRLLCGDSEMNEFFWMLSNCSEFWDYCKPRQLHSRDKCVKSLNSKRNLPVFMI